MDNKMEQQVKSVESMLELLLRTIRNDSMIDWISEVAVGRNEGGAYLSMYQPPRKDGGYLTGRFCTCYEQDWHKLPPFIVEEAKKRLTKARQARGVNNRDEDRKEGLAWEINPIVKVTRFKWDMNDEKELWRFNAIHKTWEVKRQEGNSAQQQPPTQTTENKGIPKPIPQTGTPRTVDQGAVASYVQFSTTPIVRSSQEQEVTFANREAAIQYAVDQGAFDHIENAAAEYEVEKKRIKITPLTAQVVFTNWVSRVKTINQAKQGGQLQEVAPAQPQQEGMSF